MSAAAAILVPAEAATLYEESAELQTATERLGALIRRHLEVTGGGSG